jgi:hypothetical protein
LNKRNYRLLDLKRELSGKHNPQPQWWFGGHEKGDPQVAFLCSQR